MNEGEKIPTNSPWIMRFEIDSGKLTSKGLDIKKIQEKIEYSMSGHDIHIVRHDDLEDLPKLVLRLRPPDHEEEDDTPVPITLKYFEDIILN
jgi:hypothetical protein